MTNPELKRQALALLKKFYGYDSFRPGQLEVIEAVCTGRDAVVIMPTGGGKSICYQMPALLSEGCVVVVSPLIALMQDQVQALIANGIPAVAINSNRSEIDNRADIDAVIHQYVWCGDVLADRHNLLTPKTYNLCAAGRTPWSTRKKTSSKSWNTT